MKITQNEDILKLQEDASSLINKILEKEKENKILFLLSGGSAFVLLKNISDINLNKNITIGMLDERFSIDPKINNFLQFKSLDFYQKAKNKGVSFIKSIPQEDESYQDLANRIEDKWKKWRKENPKGKIIITEGMGSDGHTAGIIPFTKDSIEFEKLFLTDINWVQGYDVLDKNIYPKRITATLSFLKNEVSYSVVYIVGEEKKEAFDFLLNEKEELWNYPIKILKEMKEVEIFTNLN